MLKTIAFVTNQSCSDRLIVAAAAVAQQNNTELMVVNVLDAEYALDPHIVDEHFSQSKRHKASMRLLFAEDKLEAMGEILSQYDVRYVVTGMPGSHASVIYDLWKDYGDKSFFTVDDNGELIEVASRKLQSMTA